MEISANVAAPAGQNYKIPHSPPSRQTVISCSSNKWKLTQLCRMPSILELPLAGLRQGWAGGGGGAAAGAAPVGAAGTAETEAGTSHVPHQTAVRYRTYDFLVDQYILSILSGD